MWGVPVNHAHMENIRRAPPCPAFHGRTDRSVFLRTYCETDIDPAHRKYSQLQAAIRYLLGKEPDLECRQLILFVPLPQINPWSFEF